MSILLTGQMCKYHSACGAMGSIISIKFPESFEFDQPLSSFTELCPFRVMRIEKGTGMGVS